MHVNIHSSDHQREEADKNYSMWLGRAKASTQDAGPPSGPLGRGKSGMGDRSFVFGRNRNARKR